MKKVVSISLVGILLIIVTVFAVAGAEKFREVPLSWILDLEEKLAKPWTPAGPNGEPITAAADLALTKAEKDAIRKQE